MGDNNPFVIHGVLMLVAWMGLLPAGVLAARYFKVWKRQDFLRSLDNPVWFYLHLSLQYVGMATACLGVAIAWDALGSLDLSDHHAQLGLVVTLLGFLQVVSAWLRGSKGGPTDKRADPARPETWRGDHYDMTIRRRLFEGWHKKVGYVALALAVPTAMMGLDRIGAPTMLVLLPPAVAALYVLIAFSLQWAGRWVPTYWAIWGLDPKHPGNRPKDGDSAT